MPLENLAVEEPAKRHKSSQEEGRDGEDDDAGRQQVVHRRRRRLADVPSQQGYAHAGSKHLRGSLSQAARTEANLTASEELDDKPSVTVKHVGASTRWPVSRRNS